MRYFLGLDNGGTTTKAALYDELGREVGICRTCCLFMILAKTLIQ